MTTRSNDPAIAYRTAHATWAASLDRTPSYTAGLFYDLIATTGQPCDTINTHIYEPILTHLRTPIAALEPAQLVHLVDDVLALADLKIRTAIAVACSPALMASSACST